MAEQSIAINALKTVVDTSLYPFYLFAIKPLITVGELLGEELRAELKEQYKEMAKQMSDRIAAEIGVPGVIRRWVIKLLFDPIWNVVDQIVDTITGRSPERIIVRRREAIEEEEDEILMIEEE